MKTTVIIAVFFLSIVAISFAQTSTITLLEPTGKVLTNGSIVAIRWISPAEVNTVRIMLYPDEYHGALVTESTPNTGEYVWKVSSQNYDMKRYTNFFLEIDGCSTNYWCGSGRGGYFTIISVPEIPSEHMPVPVLVSIKKVVSIEWVSTPAHVYRLESSTDLKNWVLESEGAINDTNAIALFYTDQTEKFYRVYDVTYSRP